MNKTTVRRFFRKLASFIKKAIILCFYCAVIFLAFRFIPWSHFTPPIDTAEVDKYYDLLKKHQRPVDVLTLSLGIQDDVALRSDLEKFGMSAKDDLPVALNRLIQAMGLEAYAISLKYGDQETPPAFVTSYNGERMVITVSKKVKLRREQMSLLVHELSHIAVWGMDKSEPMNCGLVNVPGSRLLAGCNQERVVDTSGFFQGQGILTLNGLTDETISTGGGGFETEKKLYGYLKPEQFGYLAARYSADHGISYESIEPFLEPAARKYFIMGNAYLSKIGYQPEKIANTAKGVCWCPACGTIVHVDLAAKNSDIQCPKCSLFIKKTNSNT